MLGTAEIIPGLGAQTGILRGHDNEARTGMKYLSLLLMASLHRDLHNIVVTLMQPLCPASRQLRAVIIYVCMYVCKYVCMYYK